MRKPLQLPAKIKRPRHRRNKKRKRSGGTELAAAAGELLAFTAFELLRAYVPGIWEVPQKPTAKKKLDPPGVIQLTKQDDGTYSE